MDNELKFGTITSDIIKSAHEVKKILGIGFLESVYEKALFVELKNKGYDVKRQSPIRVEYKGEEIGNFFADIIVNEKVIIELKAVIKLANEHYAQLKNYLSASNFEVGLLINFGSPKLEYRRLEVINYDPDCEL